MCCLRAPYSANGGLIDRTVHKFLVETQVLIIAIALVLGGYNTLRP